MATAAPRTRRIALALAALLLAALAARHWIETREPSATPPTAPPLPAASRAPTDPVRPAARQPSASAPQRASPAAAPPTDPSSRPQPTRAVFDFASMTPPVDSGERRSEERFRTNQRFTAEDLRHPERYFEFAQQVPEMNRPEERRDTLAFFLAYREQLVRDLEDVGDNADQRQEIHATIERYDAAIARLRGLLDTEGTN
jgi:hypothetical protein